MKPDDPLGAFDPAQEINSQQQNARAEAIAEPKFAPGALVDVCEATWPPESGNLIHKTGLYDRVGCPDTSKGVGPDNEVLRKHLIGVVHRHERCLVVAVVFCEADNTWYYLLNSSKPYGFGWTRCASRLKAV